MTPRMNPVTLRFPLEWERAFRKATLGRTRFQTRVAYGLAFVNLSGIGVWYLLSVPAERGGTAIGAMFLLGAVPALLALLVALGPWFQPLRAIAHGGSILLTGLALCAVSFLVPNNLGATVTTVSVVVVLLFGFVFLGTDVSSAVPAGVVVTAAAVV